MRWRASLSRQMWTFCRCRLPGLLLWNGFKLLLMNGPAEEAQPTVKAKSAPTRPSPKRPAQKRMTTDHGSTCRPGFNSCGLDPFYLKSVGSPEDQPRKAGRDGIRDGHTTAGACISSAFQFLNACHACHACRAPVPQGLETKPSSVHQRKGS